MKRVLVPFGLSELGGSQLSFLKLTELLSEEPIEFHCWLFSEGPLQQECDKRDISYQLFPSHYLKSPLGLVSLLNELKKLSPHLIYLHASRVISLLAQFLKIPCLERINMTRRPEAGGWCRYPWVDRLCCNFNSHLLAVSEAIKDQLIERGINKDKVTVIRNCVDFKKYNRPELREITRQKLGVSEEKTVILNIGRFVPQKSQKDFLNVAAELVEENDELIFFLVGEGPLKEILIQQIQELNLKKNIQLLPFQDDIEKIYAASDILLHTAHWEPLANVLLEARAAQLAIVATDVDGSREALKNYSQGKLSEPGDINSLKQSVLHFVNNPSQTGSLKLPEVYQPTYVKEQFKKLFNVLMSSGEKL